MGRLQFDVLLDRLAREYRVAAELEPLPFRAARWVTGSREEIGRLASPYGPRFVEDADGEAMFLFANEWALERAERDAKEIQFHDIQPTARTGG